MIIHFIWVGQDKIPEIFSENVKKIKKENPNDQIIEWDDESLQTTLIKYGRETLYSNSSIFHKLQLARYTILDLYGGLYCDYDVYWKLPIADVVNHKKTDKDMIFIKRNSVFFYKKRDSVIKTNLLDDYVIYAEPKITNEFINYSLDRSKDLGRLKQDITEPFSVYSLTEWIHDSNYKLEFFNHDEIYDNQECKFAFHENKKTWNV